MNQNSTKHAQPLYNFISPHLIQTLHRMVEDTEDFVTEVHRIQDQHLFPLNMTTFVDSLMVNFGSRDNFLFEKLSSANTLDVCHFFNTKAGSSIVSEFAAKIVGDVQEQHYPKKNGSFTATSFSPSFSSTATFLLCSHGSLVSVD